MPGKKISVKEMKHDGLVEAVASTAGFFHRHLIPIAVLTAAAVAAVVIFGVISYRTSSRLTAAARDLTAARSRESLRQVYETYPETPAAPLALIQYGAFSFSEGEFGPAGEAYRLFRKRYPQHILSSFAQLGIAAALEAENRWDESIEAYRRVGELFPESALVPEAEFNRARCYQESGRFVEAAREYRSLFERFPQSPYGMLARNELAALLFTSPFGSRG